METIHYILDNWDYLLTLTLQHLWLVSTRRGPGDCYWRAAGYFNCPP